MKIMTMKTTMKTILIIIILGCGHSSVYGQLSSSWINSIQDKGVDITCDLPDSEMMANIGSKVDGAGMCVMSSIEMAARYQNLEEMRGLRNWCAKERGGAYPSKVDQQLSRWFKEKSIKPIPYMQYEGRAPEAILSLIDKTNRMACITYGQSPRYGRGTIGHMVCCVMYGRGGHAVVLDNNYIGEKKLEWMPKEELVRRMKIPGGSAWVFVWLTTGSPPPPRLKR